MYYSVVTVTFAFNGASYNNVEKHPCKWFIGNKVSKKLTRSSAGTYQCKFTEVNVTVPINVS